MPPRPVTCFYDASCPLCALEMDHLQARAAPESLVLVDISAAEFDAGQFGFVACELDAAMHVVRPDGSVVRGMAALRAAYAAAGLGWVLRFTGRPGVKPVFDGLYGLFARHRHAISGALTPVLRALEGSRAASRRRAR